jgi:signal transduction histidine kinase
MKRQLAKEKSVKFRGEAYFEYRHRRKTWQINPVLEINPIKHPMAKQVSFESPDYQLKSMTQNEDLVCEMDRIISMWGISRQGTALVEEENRRLKARNKNLQSLHEELNATRLACEEQVQKQRHTIRVLNEKLAEYQHVNSHHLRAPVVTILGLVSLMRIMELDQLGEVVEKLEETAKELNSITLEVQKIVTEF